MNTWNKEIISIIKKTPDAKVEDIVAHLFTLIPAEPTEKETESLTRIVKSVINTYCKEQMELDTPVYILQSEVDFLKTIPNPRHRLILYTMFLNAKAHPHASEWIIVNDIIVKEILDKLKPGEIGEVSEYGLEMRVYGKNKYLLTFFNPTRSLEENLGENFDDSVVADFTIRSAKEWFNGNL